MSGEKKRYVSVEDQELRRLREQESRLRSISQDLPERLNAVRQQAQRDFQQRLAPLEKRNQEQQKEVQNLRSNLRNMELETNQRLQQQRQEFQKKIQDSQQSQTEALKRESAQLNASMKQGFKQQREEYLNLTRQQRQEYLNLINQQDSKFTNLIQQEREARQQGQQILQQQINQVVSNVEQEKQRKQTIAENLLNDLDIIWEQINLGYQHQRFTPGRLNDLKRNLEFSRSNINSGITEAAIATCQQTYLDLADLRLKLEQKEQEWQLYYHATLTDLGSLITEVRANRECELEVGELGEGEKFQVEVDYWVNGRLSDYEKQLTSLEKQLKDGEKTLTTEEIKEIGQKIAQLEPVLGDIVEQAKLAILSSQLRVEIADRVVETLSSLGYTMNDAVYEGEDDRNAYVVKMHNIAGDEVVTVITPEKEFGTNSVSINTFSSTILDEKATQQQAKAIFEVLEEEGVNGQGEIQCNQNAKTEYQDLRQVKQKLDRRQSR